MQTIEIRQGDTVQLKLNLTENGQPFVPDQEKIVFTLSRHGKALFSLTAEDGVFRIPHELTRDLKPLRGVDEYKFDVRVYDPNRNMVATPVVGVFRVLEVVNHDLL